MNNTEFVIIITSNEPWGDVWYSKQHYANELSKNNFVYFVNPPGKWKFSNIFSFLIRKEFVNETLIVLNYNNNFPVFSILKIIARLLNDICNSLKFKYLIKKNDKNLILFWLFDPFRFEHIFFFYGSTRIYHVVDPYSNVVSDRKIARNSNLIVSVSKNYIAHYKKYNENVIIVPHGISDDEFNTDAKIIEELSKKYGDYILLVGTINDRIDLLLLKKILVFFKNNKLLVIGPLLFKDNNNYKQFNSLLIFENMKYLGSINAKSINNFIKASSVCILCYKQEENEFCRGTPLKVSNYLSQNKIIISSTYFYDLVEFNYKIIYMVKHHTDFLYFLKQAINENLYYDIDLANSYKKKISYSNLINRIFENIKS